MILKRFVAVQTATIERFVNPGCLGPPGAQGKMDRPETGKTRTSHSSHAKGGLVLKADF